MSRRRAIAALSGAALALVTTAVIAETTANADPGGLRLQAHQDLGLTVIPCDGCTLNPLGFTVGDHIGEFLVNHGTLTDHRGVVIGHFAVHLVGTTVATGTPPETELAGTLVLPNGQITFQGIEEPPGEGATVAITGGTGRYRASRGELTFHDVDETTTELILTIR